VEFIHTACIEVEGGRIGAARTPDGAMTLEFALSLSPGPVGTVRGTCPEQLFAAAYGASFGSTLDLEARQLGIILAGCTVAASVSLGHGDEGCFALSVELRIHLPGLDAVTARRLVRSAHAECPYSRMGRGNIEIRLLLTEVVGHEGREIRDILTDPE